MSRRRKIIYAAGFLFSLPIALMSYINSSFLSSFIGENRMGLVYAVASLGAILATLTAPYALKKFGVHKFLVFLIGLDALSVLTFTLSESGSLIVVSFILGMAINTLIVFALDELLKIFSDNAGLGRIRGTYLAIGT